MAFRSVGINHPRPDGLAGLLGNLETLRAAGAGFVELWIADLGVILGGRLDEHRLGEVREVLLAASLTSGLSYTVHAPLEADLMDLDRREVQRDVLLSSVRFAGGIGAPVVVCHAGQRAGARDARHRLKYQLAAERAVLREIGEEAGDLGVTVAVENYYPDERVLRGEAYDYSVWPSELADQVAAVDHPAVGVCLDVGHAALAADFFGFDLFAECAAAAPLVRHVHLHDNLGKTGLGVDPRDYGDPVYGAGDLHLPPGRGSLPLEDLFRQTELPTDPACCVELAPGHFAEAPRALNAAREIMARTAREKISL